MILMDPLLHKFKVGQLQPKIQQEVFELTASLGHESTITSESCVDSLFRLFQSEEAKKDRKKLKKAEQLILAISAALNWEVQQREMDRKKSGTMPKVWTGTGISVSKRTKELCESVGIYDEKAMEDIVGTIGDAKVEHRVEIVLSSVLGEFLEKRLIGERPQIMLAHDDEQFSLAIETLEIKKHLVDDWCKSKGLEPDHATYNYIPEMLFEDYKEIGRLLELKPPETEPLSESESRRKLVVNRIHPDDFIKVLKKLGFELKSSGPHRVLSHQDGRVSVVQSAH